MSVYDNTTNTTTNTSVSLHPCTDRAYLGGVYGASNVIVNTSLFAVSYPAGTNTSVNVSALPSVRPPACLEKCSPRTARHPPLPGH